MMAVLRMMAVVMTMMMVLIDDDGGDGDVDYDGDDAVMVLFHTKDRINTHCGWKHVMGSHMCNVAKAPLT